MFHICGDEILAVSLMLPFVGVWLTLVRATIRSWRS